MIYVSSNNNIMDYDCSDLYRQLFHKKWKHEDIARLLLDLGEIMEVHIFHKIGKDKNAVILTALGKYLYAKNMTYEGIVNITKFMYNKFIKITKEEFDKSTNIENKLTIMKNTSGVYSILSTFVDVDQKVFFDMKMVCHLCVNNIADKVPYSPRTRS